MRTICIAIAYLQEKLVEYAMETTLESMGSIMIRKLCVKIVLSNFIIH